MLKQSLPPTLLLTLLSALPSYAQEVSEHGVVAGCWEYRANVAFIPVGTQFRQLAVSEIDDFLFHPCTRRYSCVYPSKTVQNGKVTLQGSWTDKKGRVAPVSVNGTYGPKVLKLNARVGVSSGTFKGMTLGGTINGKWVAPVCPVPG